MKLLTIEGNIAVGKSSLIQSLKDKFEDNGDIIFLCEPVEEWQQHGFLHGMYEGIIPVGEFQHMVLASMAAQLVASAKKTPTLIVQERSLHSTYEVFSKANLNNMSLELFQYSVEKIIDSLDLEVSHVYLRAKEHTLVQRLQSRNRESERSISLDYLRTLNDSHDKWLLQHKQAVVIDANGDTESIFAEVANKIYRFCK